MLTKITAYSQWTTIEPLVWNVINRPETDLFEVRDVQGLGSVKASVNTTPRGAVKGSSFNGTNVAERNLVFTIGLDPDWDTWTISRLRRLLDKYFMPEMQVRFVFETMEFSPVEISGIVESNEPNMFSKDPEQQISVICPNPDFRSVDPITITGSTDEDPLVIDYEGNIETGIYVNITRASGTDPDYVGVRVEDPNETFIQLDPTAAGPVIDATKRVEINTVPGEKYARNVSVPGGVITNLLNDAEINIRWPVIGPGTVNFQVYSNNGIQNWELTYYELFGSL